MSLPTSHLSKLPTPIVLSSLWWNFFLSGSMLFGLNDSHFSLSPSWCPNNVRKESQRADGLGQTWWHSPHCSIAWPCSRWNWGWDKEENGRVPNPHSHMCPLLSELPEAGGTFHWRTLAPSGSRASCLTLSSLINSRFWAFCSGPWATLPYVSTNPGVHSKKPK